MCLNAFLRRFSHIFTFTSQFWVIKRSSTSPDTSYLLLCVSEGGKSIYGSKNDVTDIQKGFFIKKYVSLAKINNSIQFLHHWFYFAEVGQLRWYEKDSISLPSPPHLLQSWRTPQSQTLHHSRPLQDLLKSESGKQVNKQQILEESYL